MDSIACCGIPELFTIFFLRPKFTFFPPVHYEISKVRMYERYVAADMAPFMVNRKCRHLSSQSHLRVCTCYSFMP